MVVDELIEFRYESTPSRNDNAPIVLEQEPFLAYYR